MEITRLFDILDHYKEIKPNQPVALAGRKDGKMISLSLQEYIDQSNLVSAGLLKLGVQKGDKIAIISSNRPEYNVLDMGIMQIGAIPVPIYPTISESDYDYILNHAEITYVFSEGEEFLRKIENILPNVKTLKEIYTFVDRGRHQYFAQLLELGRENLDLEKIAEIKASIKPSDVACMIYTSGTTGQPKGVMLSHNNIVMQVKGVADIPSPQNERALSFLPLCHAYEKLMVYLYQYLGMSVYYADNLGKISENIKEYNPNMMTCVPRVLEKIHTKLFQSGKKLPFVQRQIYYWAMNLAYKYKIDDRTAWYETKWKVADKLIYSKWRDAIGGDWDRIVSGGAAIQPRLVSFFSCIGLQIFEGYGLTETSPVIAVSRNGKYARAAGTVGLPLPGVEVRIDSETNEIQCRGHNVMIGYYKAPELTAEVIDKDGWFHTGDTGEINKHGLVIVKGRLKSIFKTSMGKYINPYLIEEKMQRSPFIDNIMVVGENQKFAGAIISPDFGFLKQWAKLHNIEYTTDAEMITNSKVIARIKVDVNKYNAKLGDTEKIKRFELVADEWTVKNGLLTPTLKVKRNIAMETYKEQIEKIFA